MMSYMLMHSNFSLFHINRRWLDNVFKVTKCCEISNHHMEVASVLFNENQGNFIKFIHICELFPGLLTFPYVLTAFSLITHFIIGFIHIIFSIWWKQLETTELQQITKLIRNKQIIIINTSVILTTSKISIKSDHFNKITFTWCPSNQ